MQTITAAAARGVVEREMQVVPPQKPLEGSAGFLLPVFFSGEVVSLQTGRDHRLGLHRLLVEAGPFTALLVKTVGADGNEMPASGIRSLQVCQPAERPQPHLGHCRVG